MAIKPLNSIQGFSVGEESANIILANGDITTTNITANGISNLGPVGNLILTGGSNGQVVTTDGLGNLTFTTVSSGSSNLAAPMPYFIPTGESYIVSNNFQGLFYEPIVIEGEFQVDGILVDVSGGGTGIPGGNTTQVQFNDAGVFAGDSGLVYDKTTSTLTSNSLIISNAANLGNISNVIITGGNANFILQTDGSGNLSWVENISTGGTPVSIAIDSFTGNGVQTQFNLSVTPANINYTTVNYNGVILLRTAYSVTGNVLTTSSPPANGSLLEVYTIAGGGATAGGSNTQVQFNDDNDFGGNAAFTFNSTTGLLSVPAIQTEGTNIANIPGANVIGAVSFATTANAVAGANVSGNVANATHSSTANTVVDSSQPNITSVGTLTSLVVGGNITPSSNVTYDLGNNTNRFKDLYLSGNTIYLGDMVMTATGTDFSVIGNLTSNNANLGNLTTANFFAGTLTTNAQPNITSVGTLSSLAVTGNISAGNVNATTFTGTLSGAATSATTAGTVTTDSQPNITSVGTLTSLSVSGNLSAGNANAGNLLTANFITGTLTTAAQPNVTSLGTLSSLSVTGNVSGANVIGNLITDSITNQSGNIAITSNTNVNFAVVGNINTGNSRISNVGAPVTDSDAATKNYVDNLVSSGIHYHEPVRVESPIALNASYNNGTSGVGATLTNAGANAALTVDGVLLSVSDRVLVYEQANAVHNGVYVVTTVGDGSTAWVLTRSSDADTYSPSTDNGLDEGSYFFVQEGVTGAGESYVCSTVGTITFGTTQINFAQFSKSLVYTAGTGLGLTNTEFFVANTAVTAASYGNGDRVASFTVNQQGQLTAASEVAITANAANLTGTTLNSTIVTSSLTSVGTLSSLSVTGNTTLGAVQSANSTYTPGNGYTSGSTAERDLFINGITVGMASALSALPVGYPITINSFNTTVSIPWDGFYMRVTDIVPGAFVSITSISFSTTSYPSTANIVGSLNVQNGIAGNGANITNINANNLSSGTVSSSRLTGSYSNITAVGTLTSLAVSGTITAANITANTGSFTGNGAGLTTLNASNISSGTLAQARLANSSLTVNGTSISLGSSGTITANTPNSLTFNNGGAGAASGTTFNGSAAQTISYNSVGAPSITGTNASGTWGINVTGSAGSAGTATNLSGFTLNSVSVPIDPNNVTQNQIGYANSVNLFGQTDGGLHSSAYSSSWIHQIFGDFRTGQIAIRGKNSGTWQAWRTVLDSGNYNSYALPLTGGTMTGQLTTRITTGTTPIVSGGGSDSFQVMGNPSNGAWMSFHRGGAYAVNLGMDTNNLVALGGWSDGGNFRWTADTAGNFTARGTIAGTNITSAGAVTSLNASHFISRTGSSGNLNTDFQNTPAGTTRIQGDDAGGTNGAGGSWWFYQNMRHSNVTNFWGTQVAWGWEDNANRLRTRNVGAGTYGAWIEYLNTAGHTFSGNLTMSGNITAYSDIRLKKDWATLSTDFVERLSKIKNGTYTRIDSEDRQAGVSAQDWQKLLPETVMTDADGMLSLAYGNAALVSAVELAKRIVEQEERIKKLEALIGKLLAGA
jgi:hypothetical protein